MGDRWLLLLPRPPSEVSLDTLSTAYNPSLNAVLHDASTRSKDSGKTTKLDIGIAYPRACGPGYASVERIFALFYELNCIACTKLEIDVQFDNDVDARIFLFQDSSIQSAQSPIQSDGIESSPFPTLDSVARSDTAWSRLYCVQSERGEGMLRHFTSLREARLTKHETTAEIVRAPGGLSIVNADTELLSEKEAAQLPRYDSIAVGGTFDHLHAGHKLLLTSTALLCGPIFGCDRRVKPCLTVGITGDALLENKKYKEYLEEWHERQQSVRAFLVDFLQLSAPKHTIIDSQASTTGTSGGRTIIDTLASGLEIRYVEIFDPYGPTIEDVDITALVISAETRSGGGSVNAKREGKDWPPLDIFEVQVLNGTESASETSSTNGAEGFTSKLSSTEIRSRIHKKKKQISDS